MTATTVDQWAELEERGDVYRAAGRPEASAFYYAAANAIDDTEALKVGRVAWDMLTSEANQEITR